MPNTLPYVVLSHDPFARREFIRRAAVRYGKIDCANCDRPARFRYGHRDDALFNRPSWDARAFCGVACRRSFYGE